MAGTGRRGEHSQSLAPRPSESRRATGRVRRGVGVTMALLLVGAGAAACSTDPTQVGSGAVTTSVPSGPPGLEGAGDDPPISAVDRPVPTGEPASGTDDDSSPTPPVEAEYPEEITLAFGGDLLPHMPLNEQAARYGAATGRTYDYAPMLEPLLPVVGEADLALCHMEVPVAPSPGRISGYPSFGSPAELVEGAKAAGYDGCTTASNHSLDQGRDGIAATLFTFDLFGLGHSGTARSEEEASTVRMYDVKGVKVASLSYAYDFNGYRIPADAPWSVNQIEPGRIIDDAAAATADGAQLVVVSLHWGNEYVHQPSPYQRDVAAAILGSPDIDLVIGHHAHVVQPITMIEGTYVVWGLGNQLSNQSQDPRRDGLTVVVTALPGFFGNEGRWFVKGIEAVPTWVDRPSMRVLPIADTLASDDVEPRLRAELDASHRRTTQILTAESTPGLTIR